MLCLQTSRFAARTARQDSNGCAPRAGTVTSDTLSVGRKTLHQNKRDRNCHTTTQAAVPAPRPDGGAAARRRGGADEHRQDGDDPDAIARLVEFLRYGFGHCCDWTTLPAPLFFESVVRDYISALGLEDAEVEVGAQYQISWMPPFRLLN